MVNLREGINQQFSLGRKHEIAMRNYIIILISTIILGGCTKYSKVVQLTPQKANGWNLSHELSISKCNDVDVLIYPVMISNEGSGVDVLFVPIQTSDKKSLEEANNGNASVMVTFKHWYRDEHIESCSRDFIEIENEDSLQRIKPTDVNKFTVGEHVNKYSTICTYLFNPKEFSISKYNLYINESALGCKFEPIPSIYEKKTKHFIYELM